MKGRLRAFLIALGTLLVGASAAQVPSAPPPPTTIDEALAVAELQFVAAVDSSDKSSAYAACRQALEPWATDAFAAYPQTAERFPWKLAMCLFAEPNGGQPRISEAEVRAWLEPWRMKLRQEETRDRLHDIQWTLSYNRLLQWIGLVADARIFLESALTLRFERLQVAPHDPLALEELGQVSRSQFGAWQHQDEVRWMHALFTRRLGEGHRLSLSLLRSYAYHERFLGRPRSALDHIEQAVALTRQHQAGDVVFGAHMATEHAACLAAVGRLVEARQRLLDARQVFAAHQPPPRHSLLRVENNLAGLALELGDLDGAIVHADQSIAHARSIGGLAMHSESLVAQATREAARLLQGEPDAAANLRETLAATLGGEMHIGSQALALVEHALQHGDSALLAWSVEFADLHIRRFRSPLQSDVALRPLMQAWLAAGPLVQPESVRTLLDRAVAISLTGRSLGTLALTHFNLARHFESRDSDTSIWLYKLGANALQQLREGLGAAEPELHRAWLANHEGDLRDLISMLIDSGRLPEAEQALALLRDEESYEYSRRSSARRVSTQALSLTRAEALRTAGLELAARDAERIATAAEQRLDAKSRQELRAGYLDPQAEADLQQLTRFVHRAVEEAPAVSRGMQTANAASTRATHSGEARLSYFVREDALDIVAVMGRRQTRTVVRVSRAELNRTIQAARSALGTPQFDALPPLQAMYRWLLAPIRAQLERAHVQRLQWEPDAALRYVPFAALHDGRQYMAERFSATTRLSGSVDKSGDVLPSSPPARRSGGIVALGRTVGDDANAALPAVAEEMAAVRGVGGRSWVDDEFSATQLRDALASGPTVVHLASHFALDAAGEEKSYLLLGDGKRLSLSELAGLPWQGVRLAVLSACESGVVVDIGSGLALVGFASTLQRAGVRNVLATLWRVSDGATARWVGMFYRRVGGSDRPRLDPRTVARTQRLWLRTTRGTPLAHPHYWAGFTWLAGR